MTQTQLCCVYYALVESHLRYGDVIWGSLSKTKITVLRRLQDRACAIIKNAKIKDNWSCSWMSVENIILNDRNIMTYKIMNKLCPKNLLDKYFQRSSISSYTNRNCKYLEIPRYRLEYPKKVFIMRH